MKYMPIVFSITTVVGLVLFAIYIFAYKKCDKENKISRKYFIKQTMSTGIFVAASATALLALRTPIEEGAISIYINGINNVLMLCVPLVAILIFINYARYNMSR